MATMVARIGVNAASANARSREHRLQDERDYKRHIDWGGDVATDATEFGGELMGFAKAQPILRALSQRCRPR
jgi:hypothetical protein